MNTAMVSFNTTVRLMVEMSQRPKYLGTKLPICLSEKKIYMDIIH